jgi:adenosylhomocysteinase
VAGHDVKDLSLGQEGRGRIEWADRDMPVLRVIRERFERERPLQGIRVAACMHVTSETANLMRTLVAGGADVLLCASNPLSTQDDVAAALVTEYGVAAYAIRGEDHDTYYAHIHAALDHRPSVVIDDGADLLGVLHADRREGLFDVIVGTEDTTTGVMRLKAMEADGVLAFPIIAVNEAQTKHLFEDRYGTGQSTIDGIVRATNVLIAGRTVVVAGYGLTGRGIADRARGMGAHVIVLEVDPMRALQAVMDGHRVMPVADAARRGDIFITVTGDKHVLRAEHFEVMRDGAIICNAGHFNVEVDVPGLEAMAVERTLPRPEIELFRLPDGRQIALLAEGRLVNLGAAEGHPASVMDMTYANQALSVEYAVRHGSVLERRVYVVPDEIDTEIARLKLRTLGLEIDQLTSEQERYLATWDEGT